MVGEILGLTPRVRAWEDRVQTARVRAREGRGQTTFSPTMSIQVRKAPKTVL